MWGLLCSLGNDFEGRKNKNASTKTETYQNPLLKVDTYLCVIVTTITSYQIISFMERERHLLELLNHFTNAIIKSGRCKFVCMVV